MLGIRYTRHASEKFDFVRDYGFDISRAEVEKVISSPDKIERKGPQIFATKALDDEFALRVVHEVRKGIIVVITFYPVKRKRYGL